MSTASASPLSPDPRSLETASGPSQPEAGWLSLLTGALPTVVWAVDADLRLTACRGAALRLLDLQPGSLVGTALAETVFGVDAVLEAHRRALSGEAVSLRATWGGRTFLVRVAPPEPGATGAGVVGVALDLTGLAEPLPGPTARREEGMRDPLTGLQSRSDFLDRADEILRVGGGRGVALLLIDLDDFGARNEAEGHEAGARLLVEVARRLTAELRGRDELARVGGDEFAILLVDVPGQRPARVAAERLRKALASAAQSELPEPLEASLGLAIASAGDTADGLFHAAETAMLRAKAQGRGRVVLAEDLADPRQEPLVRIEAELRRALERDDFKAHFEPTMAVKSGKITGFEVLLWRRSPDRRVASRVRA